MDIEKLENLYKSLTKLATAFKGLEDVLKQPDALTFAFDEHVNPQVSILVGEFVYLYENLKSREFCEHLSGIEKLGYYDESIRKQIVELEKLCPIGFEALNNGCFEYIGFFYDRWYYNNFHQIYHDVAKEITELSKIFDFYFSSGETNSSNIELGSETEKEKVSAPKRGKPGRPTQSFKELMIEDENGKKLQKIHDLVKGAKGKRFALIITACIQKGWITKPTYATLTKEFGNEIGAQQGLLKYLDNPKAFSENEFRGALKALDKD